MQSRKSFFNLALFRSDLTRFWPLCVSFTAIWLLLMPASILADDHWNGLEYAMCTESREIFFLSETPSILLCACYGILVTMALFGYLYSHRASAGIHSMPFRRSTLFVTHYLSGLVMFLIPVGVNFLATLAAESIRGILYLPALLTWLGANLCYFLFFYSFAVFCAMFTGHILALPVFYAILNVLAAGIYLMVEEILALFFFGFGYSLSTSGFSSVVYTLSPIIKLCAECGSTTLLYTMHDGELYDIGSFTGWSYALLYAAVGVVLAAAAYLVYRRHHVERAGDVVSVKPLRPVFQVGVSLCAALAGGLLLFLMFHYDSALGTGAIWWLLLYMWICGLIGWFLCAMLLNKSLRAFQRRQWLHYGIFACVLSLVMIAGVRFDLTGYQSWLPDSSNVSSVSLSNIYSAYPGDDMEGDLIFTDPDAIEAVIAFHAQLVESRDEVIDTISDLSHGLVEYYEDVPTSEYGSVYCASGGSFYATLSYTMTDGSVRTRSYNIPMVDADMDDPNTLTGKLNYLLNERSELRDQFFARESTEGYTLYDAEVSYDYLDGSDSELYLCEGSTVLNGEEAEGLLAAVKADLKTGGIGQVWLMYSLDYVTSSYGGNEIYFTFRTAQTDAEDMDQEALYWSSTYTNHDYTYYTCVIHPSVNSTNTIAYLRELGVLNENQFWMTRVESDLFYKTEGKIISSATRELFEG